jgi:hypothetical protein
MAAFSQWIGRMAAAGAAVLAIVWVLEARPVPDPPSLTLADAACRYNQALARSDAFVAGLPRPANTCAPTPEARPHWDQPRLMQGLAAGAVAVVLLLLAAREGKDHG